VYTQLELVKKGFKRPKLTQERADPYDSSEQGLENVFDRVETASNDLLTDIRERCL
jgi:protein-tyrosine-phosphatase